MDRGWWYAKVKGEGKGDLHSRWEENCHYWRVLFFIHDKLNRYVIIMLYSLDLQTDTFWTLNNIIPVPLEIKSAFIYQSKRTDLPLN